MRMQWWATDSGKFNRIVTVLTCRAENWFVISEGLRSISVIRNYPMMNKRMIRNSKLEGIKRKELPAHNEVSSRHCTKRNQKLRRDICIRKCRNILNGKRSDTAHLFHSLKKVADYWDYFTFLSLSQCFWKLNSYTFIIVALCFQSNFWNYYVARFCLILVIQIIF